MINRTKMLQTIFDCFVQMMQWMVNSPERHAEYQYKAEILIRLLESMDCGQIGGFDRENPHCRNTANHLFDRFLTLVKKENTEVKPSGNFTLKGMTDFWKSINGFIQHFSIC